MNNDEATALNHKRRRATGIGPYIFSLLIIIIPATAAYYFHLESQANYHQKRAFRALDEAGRLLDRNIEAFGKLYPKINDSGVIDQASANKNSLAIQANSIFTDINFNLMPRDKDKDKDKAKAKAKAKGKGKGKGKGKAKYTVTATATATATDTATDTAKTCSLPLPEKLGFKRVQGKVRLAKEFCPKNTFQAIKSTVSLDPILADLRRRREFDVIALVRPDGDVLYSTETERSDFFSRQSSEKPVSSTKHYRNVTYLLQLATCKLQQNGNKPAADKACDGDIELGQAAFVEINVGDATQLVFIQPYLPRHEKVFCDFRSDGCTNVSGADKDTDKQTGYIVGVVDASRFSERVQRLPPNIIAGVTLFVLIALLLAPYLRIALGGPLASISQLFTGYLLSAGVLSTGITIIFILWATLGRSILEMGEYSAEKIASNIEMDVRDELIGMLRTYSYLRDQTSSPPSNDIASIDYRPPYKVLFFANAEGKIIKDKYIFDFRDAPFKGADVSGRNYFKQAYENGLTLNKFQDQTEAIRVLPAFAIERIMSYSTGSLSTAIAIPEHGIKGNSTPDNSNIASIDYRPPYKVLFFANAEGKSIKDKYIFDFRDAPFKGADVSGRNYFKQAYENGLTLNKFQDQDETIRALPAFAIERIMSYSTGSLSTAIAIPERGIKGNSTPDNSKVGVISGPLQSLSAPVLPDGFHFAIIEDQTGLVIAHDNAGRVLVEDFFREADDNPTLRASVKGRQSKAFHGKYHGRQSYFYTRAIQGLPWSVVVIQDKTLVQMSRLEIAAIALGELLLIFMVIGCCILGSIIFWRREPWTWLWPMRRNIFDCHPLIFWVAIIVLLGVLIAGVSVILSFSGFWLIYWTSIVMLCGAHLMYLVSAQPFDVAVLQHRRWRTPAVLVLALFLLTGLLITVYRAFTSDGVSVSDCLIFGVIATALLTALTYGMPNLLQLIWNKPKPGASCPQGRNSENEQSTHTISQLIVSEPLRRFRHISAGVLCLLMFGGLPAGAAFKDAYETYMDLLFRYSAIDAATGFDRRVGELRNYIGSLGQDKREKSGLGWTRAYGFSNEGSNRGVFLSDSLLTDISAIDSSSRLGHTVGDSSSKCNSDSNALALPGLASFIVDNAFPVDERMARLHLAQGNCSDDERWYWSQELDSSSIKLNYLTKNGLPGRNDSNNWMVLTLNPSVFHTYSTSYTAIFILLMLVYIGILYFQVSITGARLGGTRIPFILHRSGKSRPNQGRVDFEKLSFKHRMVLRASDRHIYEKDSLSTLWKCEVLKLDTASKPEFIRLQKLLDSNPDVEIKVLHLALLLDDVEQRRKILPLLECLVKENLDTKITLYADFNPLYRLTRPDAYRDNTSVDGGVVRDRESLRWSSLLSKFAKEYAWTPRDNLTWLDWKSKSRVGDLTCAREMRIFHPESKVETLLQQKFLYARKEGLYSDDDDIPAEDIIALACELGGAYYRKLWEECTHNERVLLHAIAAGRCVNTLNIEIISHLMRRGLLVMEPSLSLVNESFAEFIREAETPETYRHWQDDEQEKGAWQALRVPFMFLLFVPIAILLVVATEELNGGIALMAPILTVIPMLMKGFGLRSPTGS